MRRFLLIIAVFLPQPIKRTLYRRVFGWRIGQGAHIGLSYLDAGEVTIGDFVHIGHFNVIHHLETLNIASGAYITNFNYVVGVKGEAPQGGSCFVVGRQVRITSHHFVDVSGTVRLGDGTVMAGRDTQVWTHSFAAAPSGFTRSVMDVTVGDGCYIGSRSILIGCSIPSGALVGAGSVVTKDFPPETERLLIAGNPAAIRKRYDFQDAVSGESPD